MSADIDNSLNEELVDDRNEDTKPNSDEEKVLDDDEENPVRLSFISFLFLFTNVYVNLLNLG